MISIHAPTRGATKLALVASAFDIFQSTLPREERLVQYSHIPILAIFQSTLPREERPNVPLTNTGFINFNPRSHERSDAITREITALTQISIHAPTRGATLGWNLYNRVLIFQSTLPREERRDDPETECGTVQNFNPRSHERSDYHTVQQCRRLLISIHAPTRGATYKAA